MHKGLQFVKLIEEKFKQYNNEERKKIIIYDKYKVKARLELLYDTMEHR